MTSAPRSKYVQLHPLTPYDIQRVERMMQRLTSYSMAVDGVPARRAAAHNFLTAAPPGRGADSKAPFEIRVGRQPIGLADLICDYPQPGTAFIGLLAIVEDCQGRGLGSAAFAAIETYAAQRLGAQMLRLAVVNTNPVEGFWEKMGFCRTGEVRPYRGEARSGLAILMEKKLHHDGSQTKPPAPPC